jgi:chemotaxis methyl-accepting protein methylase
MGVVRALTGHRSTGYHHDAGVYSRRVLTATRFYRNIPQIEVLFDVILPSLRQREGDRPLRLAVLGCSVGCEPYTLAIEAARRGLAQDLEIHGLDIDARCVRAARRGRYREDVFQQQSIGGVEVVPPVIVETFFSRLFFHQGAFQIRADIRKAVTFGVFDVLNPDWSTVHPSTFDVICFQNILLHFSQAAADQAMTTLLRLAAPGACLVLGGSDLDWIETLDRRFGVISVTERMQEIHEGWLTRRHLYRSGDRSYLALEPFGVRGHAGVCRYGSLFWVGAQHAGTGVPPGSGEQRYR